MKRLRLAAALALAASVAVVSPAAAADFPEQPGAVPACPVVTALPKDIIAHLQGVSPAASARLLALLTDACLTG